MEDADNINLLQIQKHGGGLAVVVRGNWSVARRQTANFLGALGAAGIRARCDVAASGQFRRLSRGAYAAYIELDQAVLRRNKFAAVRAMLLALDAELKLSGPAAAFSRANIFEQVARAAGMKPDESAATFGLSRDEVAAAIARNQNPDDVIVLPEESYEPPESGFQIFATPPSPAGHDRAVTAAERDAARQKDWDKRIDIAPLEGRHAAVTVSFPASSCDMPSYEVAMRSADAFRQALRREGFAVRDSYVSGFGTQSQRIENGIAITVSSSKQAFALAQTLQPLGFSAARLDEVRHAVRQESGMGLLRHLLPKQLFQ
jgi:hypothetical protein